MAKFSGLLARANRETGEVTVLGIEPNTPPSECYQAMSLIGMDIDAIRTMKTATRDSAVAKAYSGPTFEADLVGASQIVKAAGKQRFWNRADHGAVHGRLL